MEKLGEQLTYVPKAKILNELNLDTKERSYWDNKTKKELIDFCLKNKLLSAQKIVELYNAYKDSSNSVLYILEANVDKSIYSKITDEYVESRLSFVNYNLKDEKIGDFKKEGIYKSDDYIHISISYTKQLRLVYGGDPKIEGYQLGDIIHIKVLEDASIFHFFRYNKFIVKCNDSPAMKMIKELIDGVFLCKTYSPKFSKEIIEKITLNPNGKSHILRATYLNGKVDKSRPSSISLSDVELEKLDMYSDLEFDMNFIKTHNCFNVDIKGFQRFVSISNMKGKLWIPAYLDKVELEDYSKEILSKLQLTLNTLKDNPAKYLPIHDDYRFVDTPQENKVFKRVANEIVMKGYRNKPFPEDFYYDLVRYAGKSFTTILKPYFCEEHEISCGFSCPECGNTDYILNAKDKKIYIKCKQCNYESEALNHLQKQKTTCCESFYDVTSYNDAIIIIPTQKAINIIKEYLENIKYDSYLTDFFYIYDGLIIEEKLNKEDFLNIGYFSPLKKIFITPQDEGLYNELRIISERCLRYNPTSEFCLECSKGEFAKSLKGVDIGANKYLVKNKNRICLPSLFGYCIGIKYDGIHTGSEMADVKFIFNENTGVINPFSTSSKDQTKVGIHVKSPEANDPKDCTNPKVNSALGHILTSYFKKDFDIIGFAMPNKLSDEIRNEMLFISQGLGIRLLIIEKEDWLKIYRYYKDDSSFNLPPQRK